MGGKDAFVLCRIFQKSGLGPPNGDRYAPFLDEEWDDEATLFIPGAEAEDDMANGDEYMNKAPPGQCDQSEPPQGIPFICKREKSEEPELLSLGQNKRARQDDPNSSHANGSEDSTTTSQEPTTMMMTTNNFSSSLLEFPLLESVEPKESQPASTVTFDSSNLEKSVPPGYLKFISNLETEILNVSMERETLKIEVMRAQAMINILQSRIDLLNKENEDLRRLVRGG
ncbi:OLC1v1026159C1 [Oldenlandia corymbosa var. corymbosa]|uniref:OLC1v1026159C1 n=1 Tax=Oldenlandia corymbosa var. corymbosa TaxID=529605 RepID=A0AAV1C6E3_OLDCO|nr:OLC1v1026159C1 [Oldenlandia corymbosa var. corymbosa]